MKVQITHVDEICDVVHLTVADCFAKTEHSTDENRFLTVYVYGPEAALLSGRYVNTDRDDHMARFYAERAVETALIAANAPISLRGLKPRGVDRYWIKFVETPTPLYRSVETPGAYTLTHPAEQLIGVNGRMAHEPTDMEIAEALR